MIKPSKQQTVIIEKEVRDWGTILGVSFIGGSIICTVMFGITAICYFSGVSSTPITIQKIFLDPFMGFISGLVISFLIGLSAISKNKVKEEVRFEFKK